MFAFPGVWTRYRGPLKKNGEKVDQEVFAFMTTEPNKLTTSINHERMPVLLSDPADFETWLSASTEDAFKLARSYAADQMRIVQSGSDRKVSWPHERGPVAQLDRASDFGSEGCGFKSCRDRQLEQYKAPGRSMNARGPAAT